MQLAAGSLFVHTSIREQNQPRYPFEVLRRFFIVMCTLYPVLGTVKYVPFLVCAPVVLLPLRLRPFRPGACRGTGRAGGRGTAGRGFAGRVASALVSAFRNRAGLAGSY